MRPERTPQAPDARTTALSSGQADDDPEFDSLLFYATYGHSKLDPEARLLAAMMDGAEGAGGAAMTLVTDTLTREDFSAEAHGDLFDLINTRWRAGELTDPTSINVALMEQGVSARPLRDLLVSLVSVDAPAWRLPDLAKQVLVAAYRRQFQRATTFLQQVADEAAAHELFPMLRKVGIEQAQADARVRQFHHQVAALPTPEVPATPVGAERPVLHTSPSSHHHGSESS